MQITTRSISRVLVVNPARPPRSPPNPSRASTMKMIGGSVLLGHVDRVVVCGHGGFLDAEKKERRKSFLLCEARFIFYFISFYSDAPCQVCVSCIYLREASAPSYKRPYFEAPRLSLSLSVASHNLWTGLRREKGQVTHTSVRPPLLHTNKSGCSCHKRTRQKTENSPPEYCHIARALLFIITHKFPLPDAAAAAIVNTQHITVDRSRNASFPRTNCNASCPSSHDKDVCS